MIARSVLAIPNAMFCRIRLHVCFVAMCVMKERYICMCERKGACVRVHVWCMCERKGACVRVYV